MQMSDYLAALALAVSIFIAGWTVGLVATVRHLRGEEKLRHATLTAVRAEDQ